jgi:hypothetical protein
MIRMKLKIQKNTRTSRYQHEFFDLDFPACFRYCRYTFEFNFCGVCSAIGRRDEAGRENWSRSWEFSKCRNRRGVGHNSATCTADLEVQDWLSIRDDLGPASGTTTPGIGRGTAADVVHVEKSSSSSSSSTRMTDLKVGILVYLMIFLHLWTTNSPTAWSASTIGCIFCTR